MGGDLVIEEISAIFSKFGTMRYGEDVDQLQHALQAAALARADDAPDSLVAAALLHDLGQFVDDAGNAAEQRGIDARHEETGAALLARGGFGPAVTEPVRLHVDAKRYLCIAEPGYAESLSAASRLSLRLQGGPMTPAEAEAFAGHRWFAEAIRLRRYDDGGKRRDWAVPGLDTYWPLLRSLLG
jgi:phosphonate degradation associated HDIG domain protein